MDFLGLQGQNREGIKGDETFSNPFDLEPGEELWQPEEVRFVNGELIIECDAEGASP